MCIYITATLPRGVNANLITPIFESHKIGFVVLSNPHVAVQLEPGDLYFQTASGYCDCNTTLGSLTRTETNAAGRLERDLKKIRKKGWSETKIQRWLEQKEATKLKHEREDETRGGTPNTDQWIGFIDDLLKSGHTRRFGLLLHWYLEDIEEARVDLLGREKATLAELDRERLLRMKEDVLLEFVV